MSRLFVAVDPPAGARAHLDQALRPLRGAPGEPRWIPAERWHLTLLFLGAVPDDGVAPLQAAVGVEVARTAPFALRLVGAGRFGPVRRPQVFWAGVEGDVAALADLADRLRAAVRALGLPVEDRPFRGHLTVGRWRPGAPADPALPGRLASYRGPEWPVTEVALLESHLGRTPRYDAVGTWTLTTRTP